MAERTIKRTLLIGLGSPHGDDQTGWIVARELARCESTVAAVALPSPADILDRLEGLDSLLVCDACRGAGVPGTVHSWRWPDLQLADARFSGTHDLSLSTALSIAVALGRLPREVIIWGIEAEQCSVASPPSSGVLRAASEVAAEVDRQFGARSPQQLGCHAMTPVSPSRVFVAPTGELIRIVSA